MDDAVDSSSSPPESLPTSLPTETEPSSSTSRGNKTATIGGLVAGIVVFLALALVLFFFLRRRYKSSRFDSTYTPAVFLEEQTGPINNPTPLTTYGRSDASKASDPSSTGTSTSYLELGQGQTRGTGRRLRNKEVVNRIAWLEGEVDRLQEEVEMRNDPELPPGYSDVMHPTK